MKKVICAVCLISLLPLTGASLFTRYGEREGNVENEKKEYLYDRTELPVKVFQGKVFQGKEIGSDWVEKDYEGIHSISFCKEWKDSEDGKNPVTVIRVVRR